MATIARGEPMQNQELGDPLRSHMWVHGPKDLCYSLLPSQNKEGTELKMEQNRVVIGAWDASACMWRITLLSPLTNPSFVFKWEHFVY